MKMTASKPAIFVDRDGTIVELLEYLDDPDKLQLIPGARTAIKRLNEREILVLLITNQSAVARGIITIRRLDEIHVRLKEMLAEGEAHLDGIYYCPHHPDDECPCRKPNTGMFDKMKRDWDIQWKLSFMIGDSGADLQAAENIGIHSILVRNGSNQIIEKEVLNGSFGKRSIVVKENLGEAVEYFLSWLDKQLQNQV